MAINADMTHATLADLVRAAHRVLARDDVAPVPRLTYQQKALAWLKSGPRTSTQLATLIGTSPNSTRCMLWQMRKLGKVERVRCWWRIV